MPLPAILAAIDLEENAAVIIFEESVIPELIEPGKVAIFKVKVQNIGIPGEFMVSIYFTGPSTYTVSSDWFNLKSEEKKDINIDFRLPARAKTGTYIAEARLFGQR